MPSIPERATPLTTERVQALEETMRAFAEATASYETLLKIIAQRTTDLFGDICAITLLSEDGAWVVPVAVATRDPAASAVRTALMSTPLALESVGIATKVIRTGVPLLIPHISREELPRFIAAEHVARAADDGICGILAVPLRVGARDIGAIALFRNNGHPSPPFDDADLAFARTIADHAALAIANARLLDSLRRELIERKQAEEEARTFVALVQTSTDFIAMAKFDGSILFVNDAGRKLVGIAHDANVTSLTLADFHTEDGLARREIIQKQGSWQGNGKLRHFTTGELIPTRVSSFIARDANGGPLCFATVQSDLREARRFEETLRQSQKMEAIGQLAGGIAHDFNNLLTVILGYGGSLAASLPKDSREAADANEVNLAAERAAALTRQLLAFSRKQVMKPVVIDLNSIITKFLPIMRRAVSEAIEIHLDLCKNLGRVEADAAQIEQVLLNLVVNARDAMRNGGALSIRTSNVDVGPGDPLLASGLAPVAHTVMSVSDTGVGIDEVSRSHIFEPFFTTKDVGKGTGLGLATVLGIVRQSGGHILVESERGRGTTFRVYLPRVALDARDAPDAPDANAASIAPASPPLDASALVTDNRDNRETLLLVEDDPQVRAFLVAVLRRAGYVVIEAEGPEEALAASDATQAPIALLVTDVIMPKMSGRELAERLVAVRPETKVLFVSGYTEDALGQRGIIDTGIDLLQKPVAPAALLDRIRKKLQRE